MRHKYLRHVFISLLAICLTIANPTTYANPLHCGCQEDCRDLLVTSPAISGLDVQELQAILHELGYFGGEITGTYGMATEAAVKELQAWLGLETSGVFGAQEREALTVLLAHESISGANPAPPAGELRIEIDIEKKTLTLFADEQVYKVYPCAVGKSSTKTPVGEWRIIQKGTNWGGGFGTRWLGLNVPWGIYGIHGTNNPRSIGTAASAGCIRMQNKDVEQLYPWISIGTRVSIIGPFPRTRISSPLRTGQSSKAVQTLQLTLREAGFNPGYTDGRYGPATEAAVCRLQAYYGLRPTGQADNNVLALLDLARR